MGLWQHYYRPTSLDEALNRLSQAGRNGRVIAGGTDLLLDMQQGREPSVGTLVDIAGVRELQGIQRQEKSVYVGAACTHHQIVASELLQHHAACLVEACALIGGPQVRNVATLGGNVAHGLPAADGTIALLALGAEAEIAGEDGRRWQLVSELITAPGQTSFDRGREILVRFRFPLSRQFEGSAFSRVMRPQGIAIAILNLACWLRLDQEGRVGTSRLAVGPAGPRPLRLAQAEASLARQRWSAETAKAVAEAVLSQAKLRTSPHRATADYRRHLIGVLIDRCLPEAFERAAMNRGEGQ